MKKLLCLISCALFAVGHTTFAMEAPTEKKLKKSKSEVYAVTNKDGGIDLYIDENDRKVKLTMQEANYSESGDLRVIAKDSYKILEDQDRSKKICGHFKLNGDRHLIVTMDGRASIYKRSQSAEEVLQVLSRKASCKAMNSSPFTNVFKRRRAKELGDLLFIKYKVNNKTKIQVAMYEKTKASRLVLPEPKVQESEKITNFETIPHVKKLQNIVVDKEHKDRIVVLGKDKKETRYKIKKAADNSLIVAKESPSRISSALRRLSFH